MKKIVIVLALMLTSVSLLGANCSWTAVAINKQNSADAVTSYVAYLVDSSVTAADFITALQKGSAEYVGSTTLLAGGPYGRINQTLTKDARTGAAFVENQPYNFYTLILNASSIDKASYYLTTTVVSGTPTAQSELTMDFSSQLNNTNWQQVVPEPTSGLLLLVGGALLALRRKQK